MAAPSAKRAHVAAGADRIRPRPVASPLADEYTEAPCPSAHVRGLKQRVRDSQAAAAAVPGLLYVDGFLTEQEEQEVLAAIDAAPWLDDLRRRVQHYGWRYDYKKRAVSTGDYLGPLPDWIQPLVRRLKHCHVVSASAKLDQAIVNEYLPGQGIAPHVDHPTMFDDEVVTISMAAPTTMSFSCRSSKATHDCRLERRSATRITGDARFKWTHGIAARRSDPAAAPHSAAKRIPRQRRVSLTLRSVRQSVAAAAGGRGGSGSATRESAP